MYICIIVSYLSTGSKTSNQFKIVIIGPPRAGKSTLIHRLLDKPLQSGKQLSKWTEVYFCKINSDSWTETDLDSSDYNAVIYDISGDDIEVGLLPLLLTPQCIVILVYNASNTSRALSSNPFAFNFEYFLRSVCSHCSTGCCSDADPNSVHWPKVVIVGTHKSFLESETVSAIVKLCSAESSGKLFGKHLIYPVKKSFLSC